MSADLSQPVSVQLWFDPVCPWCWVTYEWLLQVTLHRALSIDLRQMSLAILNENKSDVPDHYKAPNARSLQLGRVVAAVRATLGQDGVRATYESMGRALHHDHEREYRTIIERALVDAGASHDLAAAADNQIIDDDLRRATSDFVSEAGLDVGTPVISIEGSAFFGPVISRAPDAVEAAEFFDALRIVTSNPYFFELKRPHVGDPTL